MEIKDLVKMKRLEYGLTLKQVAERVGVTEATVSRWESGDIENIRRNHIAKLAEVLHISPMAILGRPSEQEARLLKYAELFTRLQELPEPEQKKAAKMIDTILTTFEE